jgi:hypothetical protein
MPLSAYFKKVLIVLIGVTLTVMFLTTVLTFAGVSPMAFNPYMYFLIAIGILAVFLSPKPSSVVD